ncbi:hypothetical protein IG631_10993 [Alternaria alternata]|nr:hypothetical protein IG631_10993 [Alternaria alternata]
MPTAIEHGAFDSSAPAETPIKQARLWKPNNQGQIRVQGIDVRFPGVAKVTSFLEGTQAARVRTGQASCLQSRWRCLWLVRFSAECQSGQSGQGVKGSCGGFVDLPRRDLGPLVLLCEECQMRVEYPSYGRAAVA